MPNNARHEDRHHRGIWFASDHVGPKLFGSKTVGVESDRRIPSHGTRRVGPSNFNDLVFQPFLVLRCRVIYPIKRTTSLGEDHLLR